MTFPVFASGDVLNASDMNAVGLWLVKSQTIGTTVSSVQVTGAFSSDYDNYLITVNGGVASTGVNLRLTLGATAAGYYYGGQNISWAGSSSAVNGSNVAFWLAGYGTTGTLELNATIGSPNLAKISTIRTLYVNPDTGSSGGILAGMLNDTTQYTAFTITTNTGTMTGGTIRVYGYRT